MATDTHAIENAQAWLENIVSMVKRLEHAQECNRRNCVMPETASEFGIRLGMPIEKLEALTDDYHDSDAALEAITESPLSVEYRSGWVNVGQATEFSASEYQILLTTGGPALRIIGELDQYGEPETARLEWSDWGTPWTEFNLWSFAESKQEDHEVFSNAINTYARAFYYGS